MDQVSVFIKIRQTFFSRGNTILNGISPTKYCGLAWGAIAHQLMSFSPFALIRSGGYNCLAFLLASLTTTSYTVTGHPDLPTEAFQEGLPAGPFAAFCFMESKEH